MDRTTAEKADTAAVAASIGRQARRLGVHVAVAESLTGGEVSAALAAAPQAAEWFAGGVVAYSAEVKHRLLEVPEGPVVSPTAAAAMAAGVQATHRAQWALGLTGVGGPGAEDGIPAGTVHLAVAGPETVTTHELQLSGSPTEVCRAATQAALTALERALTDAPVPATA